MSTRTLARRAGLGKGQIPYVRKLPGIRGGYLFDATVIDYLERQLDHTARPTSLEGSAA